MPYRFTNFTVEGELTNLDGLEAGEPARITPEGLGPRRDELPLNNQVIAFPKAERAPARPHGPSVRT